MTLFAFAASRLLHNKPGACFRWVPRNVVATALFLFSWTAQAEIVDMRPAATVGSFRQVRAVIESEGKLKLNADGQEVKHLPLKVEGELLYGERILSQTKNWTQSRVVRSYLKAFATIRLHQSDLKTELRPDRQLIAVESGAADSLTFSPSGPLTREELELLEPPGSGLTLESLLSPRPVQTGSQWPLADATVARLLGLEAVSQHDLVAKLVSAKDGVALIEFAGKVTGAVGGVNSDSELKGKLNFDLNKRAISWFTLAVKENRAIGHAKPGFEVVTTIRMVIAPTTPLAALQDKALAGLPLTPTAGEKLVEFSAGDAGFKLHHDRRWSIMLDRPDLAVLRFVDRGDLIAQCNITPRPALGPDQALTMDGFQAEVKRVLGKNFEEIVEATEETDDHNRRLLRVVVAGKTGDLPIQWTYYELSDEKGRRASLVFTLESSLLERFASLDRELLAGLHFTATKQPTPADAESTKSSKAPKPTASILR